MVHALKNAPLTPLNHNNSIAFISYHAGAENDSDSLESYLTHVLSQLALTSKRHIAIALSGGSDSMALTLLMVRWAAMHGCKITALTVNHGLRYEAASEAMQTHAIMNSHGITHIILNPTLDATIRNIQQRAREARYSAMSAWCKENNTSHLMAAHTYEDQAETLALQTHRGTSSTSQSAMALISHWNNAALVRPLLGVRKQTLIAWLKSHHYSWVEDPTNASNTYARNRLRRTISEKEIIANWQHAQDQGALRHAEDVARNEWCNTHCDLHAFGFIKCNRFAWLGLDETQRSDILSRAIMHVSGAHHRPRHHESIRLASRITSLIKGKATLGGTIIFWNESHISISRELSRLPAPITLYPSHTPQHIMWDYRFALTYQLLAPTILAPLGRSGVNHLRQTKHPITSNCENIHSSFLFSLPTLWHLDTVLFVPHIDYRLPDSNASDTFTAHFSPSKPLAGEPFWWFNHAPYHT